MTTRAPLDPRAEELLCQDALEGLNEAELRELSALLGPALEEERALWGRAVAGVDLAHVPASAQLPEALRDRILVSAEPFVAPPARPSSASVQPLPRRDRRIVPWLLAAACFLVALLAILVRPVPPPSPPQIVSVVVSVPVPPPAPPAPEEARTRLLAQGKANPIPWGGTKDPAAKGVEGDVVWDNARQEGYMRFRGLAANDPKKLQYQLWIFDKNQDQRYPVDGGVFDVNSDGEVVVPITAKIAVREPTLFAITIEKPGGVVVSSRERLVLAAKVPAG